MLCVRLDARVMNPKRTTQRFYFTHIYIIKTSCYVFEYMNLNCKLYEVD